MNAARRRVAELLAGWSERLARTASRVRPALGPAEVTHTSHPDGTVRDRVGNVVGGWGAGGVTSFASSTVTSQGHRPDRTRSSASAMTIGRLGA